MSKQQGNKNGSMVEKPKNSQGYERLPQNDPLTQIKPPAKKNPVVKQKNQKQGPKSFKIGSDNSDEKWTCSTCTFRVCNSLHECGMCGEPRQ